MTGEPAVLADHTVVEATHSVAGAMTGRLLAEFGADVVLLETGEGHPLRHVGRGEAADHYFEALMAGKRSLFVEELDDPAVVDVLAGTDVIVEDGGRQVATAEDATLLRCVIQPFGDGAAVPPGVADPLVQARTGLTATSGFPAGQPASSAVPIAAGMGATVACGSILARLYAGSRSEPVEVSLQEAVLPLLTTFVPAAVAPGESVGRSGNRHPLSAPWNTYRASDGWVYLIAWTDAHWERFLALADREDLHNDDRFASNRDRRHHADAVDEIVGTWVAEHTVEEVVSLANEHGLTAASIRDVAAAFDDENLEYRDMVTESNGHSIPGSPLALSETPGRLRSTAPEPGGGTQ